MYDCTTAGNTAWGAAASFLRKIPESHQAVSGTASPRQQSAKSVKKRAPRELCRVTAGSALCIIRNPTTAANFKINPVRRTLYHFDRQIKPEIYE